LARLGEVTAVETALIVDEMNVYFQDESTDDGGAKAQALYDYQAGKTFFTFSSR
jgi:hypothetical protein